MKNNQTCKNISSIPGYGTSTSSAYYNKVGNGSSFNKGRNVSASVGIVPKQYSSGGKDTLLCISKRGDKYLRCLLIQGAKSVVSKAKHKSDKLSQWINHLVQTIGHNKASVAYANKMARMAWAVNVSGAPYQGDCEPILTG